jgi:HlyD family secretion protein
MPTTTFQHNNTPNLSQGFNQRSSLVKELISSKPSFVIRWGIVIFFFIIVLLGVLCWFIQYPDIVVAKAKLSSVNAPKQVITRSDGKLTKILITENQEVKTGQVLAYMESLANPEAVMFISNQIDSIGILINQNRTNEIVKYFPTYNNENTLKNLGELQQQYQTFIQSFITINTMSIEFNIT